MFKYTETHARTHTGRERAREIEKERHSTQNQQIIDLKNVRVQFAVRLKAERMQAIPNKWFEFEQN